MDDDFYAAGDDALGYPNDPIDEQDAEQERIHAELDPQEDHKSDNDSDAAADGAE